MQADEKQKTIEMFRFPRLRGEQVVKVIATLAEAHGDLDAVGLRLQKSERDWYSIYLPAHRGRENTPRRQALHRDLIAAVQEAAGNASAGRSTQQAAPFSTEGMFGPRDGIVVIAAETAPTEPLDDIPDDLLILARHASGGTAIASVLRQGRDARITTSAEDRVAILVDNAAERYASVSDLLGRGDLPEDFVALRPWAAGRAMLWLPVDQGPPSPTTLGAVGRAWAAWAKPDENTDPKPADMACVLAANGTDYVLHVLPSQARTEALAVEEVIAPDLEPVQVFDIQTLTYASAAAAAKGLTDEILRNSDQIGYRVRLHPVPPTVSAGIDVEPLLEQIGDLKLRIAQINALGAPQQRLLRFSDAQLPALVDVLRRLPPDTLQDGSLKYAAGHSQGRIEPAHYLLYDATATHVRFPQTLWQARTETRPMSYWLEPFVAQAQMTRPTQTRVFVPDRHMLSPSLAHFGSDVDGTLKLILGSLFVSLGDLASDSARKPYFIFTQLPDKPGMLEVEVVDGDHFEPVIQQIGWMNDYLQVRGPNIVDRDKLRAVSEELYEGAFVEEVRHALEQEIADTTASWEAGLEQVRAEAAGLLSDHSRELAQVSHRIAQAHEYLRNARRELTGLERLMDLASQALQGRKDIEATMVSRDLEIRAAAETFTEAMDREIAEGDRRIVAAEGKLADLMARLERLEGRGR